MYALSEILESAREVIFILVRLHIVHIDIALGGVADPAFRVPGLVAYSGTVPPPPTCV